MDTIRDTATQLSEQSTKEKIFKVLNLSVPVLMGIFIFFNPFPHTTTIKEICFYGSVIIVLILIYFKKIDFSFKSPLTLPFALFTAWAFIGLFFAIDKENSVHDFYAHLLKYLAIYYILINFINSRKRFETLSWIIICSVTIFSIGGMIYFYLILGNPISTRIYFQEITINSIGFITLFAIILSFNAFHSTSNLYLKFVLLIALIGITMATLLTQSRGDLVAIILSSLILLPKNKKSVITFLLFVVLITNLTFVGNRINLNIIKNERLHIWYTYIEAIKDYPIFGTGFSSDKWLSQSFWEKYSAKVPTKFRVAKQYRTPNYHPHNILVSITLRLGFVGLILFLYIISMFGRMCWANIVHGKNRFIKSWGLCLTAASIAYFTKGMFELALTQAPAVVFYTILAMVTILLRLDDFIMTGDIEY